MLFCVQLDKVHSKEIARLEAGLLGSVFVRYAVGLGSVVRLFSILPEWTSVWAGEKHEAGFENSLIWQNFINIETTLGNI